MKKHILVVDDDPINIKIIENILKDDYEIIKAKEASEALEMMHQYKPGIVLLDIMMPGIDGYEVTKIIKSHHAYHLTKIILVSAKSLSEDRLEGYKKGAYDYIMKPFDHDELKAKVHIFWRLYETEYQLQELNKDLEDEVKRVTNEIFGIEKEALLGLQLSDFLLKLKGPWDTFINMGRVLSIKHPHDESIKKIKKSIDGLSPTLENILASIWEEEDPREIDINRLIISEVELVKVSSFNKNDIVVSLKLGDIPMTKGVFPHFHQVIGGILKESVISMHQKPENILTIETKSNECTIDIIISDKGHEIPLFKETVPHFRMIEAYGGQVDYSYRMNEGNTIVIMLPIK